MADANSSNFGQSGPKSYDETNVSSITIQGKPVDPKTAGTFMVNRIVRGASFDPQARLTSTGGPIKMRVDGIRKKEGGPERPLTKEEEIRLTTRIEFLIKEAEETFQLRADFDDGSGAKHLEESFSEIIGELQEMEEALRSPSLTEESLKEIKLALAEREEDINNHKNAHQQSIQNLKAFAEQRDKDVASLSGTSSTAKQEAELEIAQAKAEAERKVFATKLGAQYEKLSQDITALRNTTLSVVGKDQLIGRYDSFSFLKNAVDASFDDLKLAHDNLPQLEADLAATMADLTALEQEATRKQRQLEIAAGVAVANFDIKLLEIRALLSDPATASEKDPTEKLLKEIEGLKKKLSTATVTEQDILEFNQKIVTLTTKASTLKNLIDQHASLVALEKMRLVRQAQTLLAQFDSKKANTISLLRNPATGRERAATETIFRELDALVAPLTTDNVTANDIATFEQKLAELDTKVVEVIALIDEDKANQESMLAWHADWPKTIKYQEPKKPSKPGATGTKGGWQKDGRMLDKQPLWAEGSTLAKRVFDKYNPTIDKARSIGKEDSVKDIIFLKKGVIDALYAENIEGAIRLLAQLEKEVDARRAAIENEVDIKELRDKFTIVKEGLTRLGGIIPTLELSLLEARSKELEAHLKEAETGLINEPLRTSNLLRLSKALLEELTSAINDKGRDVKQESAARLSEFKELTRKIELIKTVVNHGFTGSSVTDAEKTAIEEKVAKAEGYGKDFGTREVEGKGVEARESLRLLKRAIEEIEADLKIINEREIKLKAEAKEKEQKKQEAKEAAAREFKSAKSFLDKLKGDIDALHVSGANREAFDRRIAELDNLAASVESATDAAKVKEFSALYLAILGEFSTLVSREFRNDRAKQAEIDTAYRALNKGKKAESVAARPLKDDAIVTLTGTIDPVTGGPQQITVAEWKRRQEERKLNGSVLEQDRRRKTEQELRAIHEEMWDRDNEAYKRLYAGRTWTRGEELTKKIVTEFLAEAVAEVDAELAPLAAEIERRNVLLGKESAGTLTEGEILELRGLDELLEPLIDERRSFTERPYDEQLRTLREEATKKSVLKDSAYTYSPAKDKSADWIGFRNRQLTKDEDTRFRKASRARLIESIRTARNKIPGVTKTMDNSEAAGITKKVMLGGGDASFIKKEDLGESNEKLAKVVFPTEAKIGTSEAEKVVGGMTRSVMVEDMPQNTTDKDLRVLNKGAYKEPDHVARTLTPEEQARRVEKADGVISTLAKHAKSWKTWIAAGAFAFGAATTGLASAQADPTRPVTTIEQVISWKDFVKGLDERNQAYLGDFIKELSRPSKEMSYESFVHKFAPSLGLKDANGALDLSKKGALDNINVSELLNGASAGIYTDHEVRGELSKVASALQQIHQMIDDHNIGKNSYQKRGYVYTADTLTFKGLFDTVRNLATRTR